MSVEQQRTDAPPKLGAYAVVRGEEPQVFLATDAEVISRVLAVYLVAQLPAKDVSSPARLQEMRQSLLEERWADALVAWMDETGVAVDVYDEAPRVWNGDDLDLEQATLEMRVTPLFSE
jgi:hypothetical protein